MGLGDYGNYEDWRAPKPKDEPLQDVKQGLHSARKPDLTHIRMAGTVYTCRNHEYGNFKYPRANFLRKPPTVKEAFEQHRGYLRAIISHAMLITQAMEKHQAMDPNLEDEAGMIAAVRDPDLDTDGTFPASKLPHHGGIGASYNILMQKAVDAGLLLPDPGQPWKETK
jgi:hypothetical protein